ncbi:MAG: phosphoribosyl-AMP cyclohydrolase [bacterium]|nr:phosphoribosyl-AMP cyclohydrolase [bacterium]
MKVYRPNFEKRGGTVTAVFQETVSGVILKAAKIDEQEWRHMLLNAVPKVQGSVNGQRLTCMCVDCDGDALVCQVEHARPGVVWHWRKERQPVFMVDEKISPVPLVTVIAQSVEDNEILMLAYTDEPGWRQTIETGFGSYYSTSRKISWVKGEESGNKQRIEELLVSERGDLLLYRVTQLGPDGKPGVACHTNARTCFYRTIIAGGDSLPAPDATANEALPVVNLPVHPNLQTVGYYG